uniref:Uncharacterized protein n=1 Tax=Anguilla anguilla TaxID=7936 RepID=A0A0E9SRR1_ANGAN
MEYHGEHEGSHNADPVGCFATEHGLFTVLTGDQQV